jgi:hypothetical protein
MRIRKGALLCAIALLLVYDQRPAWAQFASAIEGTITDTTGGLVPGATVTLSNEETGVTQTSVTTDAGYYRFPALGGGMYTVKVSLSGFKTAVQEHIRLEAADTKAINLRMEVGLQQEEVTVQGAAPLVETSEGRVSGLIEESQVKDLPLSGRNFFGLVVLTPGVTGRGSGGGQAYAQSSSDLYSNEFSVNMNANGARSESNNFLVDSATVSSSQRTGVVNVNPNAEDVQEVRVSVNNFTAENGRNGSILVNIITKSGTNDIHGSTGFYFTNQNLQAENIFQQKIANFQHPEFGRKELSWGVGGPITKDHTFFFVSGDVLRSDVAISRDSSVITPDFAAFMKANRPNNVSTYIMNNFPAKFAPDRNFQTAGQLLGASCSGATPISSPIGQIPCNLNVTGVGTWNDTSPRNGLQWTGRVDHYMNSGKDRIYGSFNRTTTDKVGFGEPSVYPGFTAPSPTSTMHFNTNWTHIASPNLVNEAAFAWVRPWGELTNPRPDVPGISISGIVGYQQTFGPNEFVQNNFEWRDVITWTRGNRTMKFGGLVTREHADNNAVRTYNRPSYNFNSVFDFANDNPDSEANLTIDPATGRQVDALTRFHRTHSIAAFVQHDWKALPNLSVNLGLRYEQYLNIYDASGDMANIQFASDSGDLRTRLTGASMVERKYYLDGGLFSGGMKTLAPRVGFAWDPSKQGVMSIRGGWGRAYDRMSNQIWDSEYLNLPGFANLSVRQSDPVKPVFALGSSQSFPYSYPRPTGLTAGLNSIGGLLSGRGSVIVVDPDIEPMYLDNWFLGVQKQLSSHLAIEADYIGSRGRNAYRQNNINRFSGDMLDGVYNGILPGLAAINYTESTDQSSFNGATFSLRTNRADLQVSAAYTIGKATDYSSSFSASSRPDPYGPASQDKGPADFDVRHKLSASVNWKLPSPSKDGAMKMVLGGWQLGIVGVAQSGNPFTVVCGGSAFVAIRDAAGNIVGNSGCDYNADGSGPDRPNTPSFGNSIGGSNDDFINGVFKKADFPTPAPGQPGTLGRNTFVGPRYVNVDMVLLRSVRFPALFGSASSAQFRLEMFNALNNTNLNQPVNTLTDPLFGKVTSALPGRIVQFALRFQF